MPDRVRISVPSVERSLDILAAVAERFAAATGIRDEDARALDDVVRDVVRFTLAHAYPADPTGEIEVSLDVAGDELRVDVHDWGLPLTAAGGELGPLPPELEAVARRVEDLRLINLGADGKRVSARLRVVHDRPDELEGHELESPPVARARGGQGAAELIEVRPARPEEHEQISQLLYANYRLTYGHPDFYRPRWITQETVAGRLTSTVAVHEGEVIGHHALMLDPRSSAGETGAAVVHPAFRGLGLLGRLLEHSLEHARRRKLEAVFGRAVTVHPYSQRSERSHGYRETALLLGAVPARMQMESIEGAVPGKRTASLVAFRVLGEPYRAAVLPPRYGAWLRDAYAHVGVTVVEGELRPPGDEPLASAHDESRASAVMTVQRFERHAVVHELRRLLAQHVDVVYADLDLTTGAASQEAIETLNELGFFYAGLILCGADGHDYLRLQRLNAENVELERIVCDSDFAQGLLRTVLDDRLRVDG
jgi:N-acetylglutamate synthase-like GNAT family acetyltransferase/anti-sigma regulatory factor (Ser/Thr protein kinase)